MEPKEIVGSKVQEILSDPLSQVARKERCSLLISSIFGIVVSSMGLVPTKISAFGIEVSPPEQAYFIIIIALVVVYFLLAYVLYEISDFFIWREKHHDYQVAVEIEGEGGGDQRGFVELRLALESPLPEAPGNVVLGISYSRNWFVKAAHEPRDVEQPLSIFVDFPRCSRQLSRIILKAPPMFALMAPPEPAIFTLQTG